MSSIPLLSTPGVFAAAGSPGAWAAVATDWLLSLAIAAGFFYLVYYLLTLPLRRQERARFFLDLLEGGLRAGRRAEDTILDLARSRDRGLGVRFHLLAAHLESGLDLVEALRRVPRLLPGSVTAMLRAGAVTGDLGRVLPACAVLLRDGRGHVSSGVNYLIVLLLAGWLPVLVVARVFAISVLPKFATIFQEISESGGRSRALESWLAFASALQWVLWPAALGVFLIGLFYVGGPRLEAWLQSGIAPVIDGLHRVLPWRRLRMLRDFSALLAVLLDAGVPEEQAVRLAAEAGDNEFFRRRAARVRAALQAGVKLPEAMSALDDRGELRWRLANAVHGAGFVTALRGWQEALDARACQQEQAVSQLVTTALVLVNGVLVGSFAIGAFGLLTELTNEAGLW